MFINLKFSQLDTKLCMKYAGIAHVFWAQFLYPDFQTKKIISTSIVERKTGYLCVNDQARFLLT